MEKSAKLWALHKNDFLCDTRFCQIFSKIGMDNVKGITNYVPNLQVYRAGLNNTVFSGVA